MEDTKMMQEQEIFPPKRPPQEPEENLEPEPAQEPEEMARERMDEQVPEQTQELTQEQDEGKDGVLEIHIDRDPVDCDHITLPVTRFEELVIAEVTLDTASKIFIAQRESYYLKDYLAVLLDPKKKDDGGHE